MKLRTLTLLMLGLLAVTSSGVAATDDTAQREDESDEDYIKRINHVYWPDEDAPNTENGLIYTVAQTLQQVKSLMNGFQVGFYHDKNKKVSSQCMGIEMSEHIRFALMVMYQPINILHVLDLIKFGQYSAEVIHHTFEYCGFKDMMHDLTVYCSLQGLDEMNEWKNCSP